MARDGTATRTRILDAAQELVIAQGFGSTTVDAVIAAAHTTKGGFFNHFPSKQDLASALVERYAAADACVLADLSARAERLSANPLQQLLLFVGLLADEVEEGIRFAPGCLFASFCYERELIDEETRTVIADSMLLWRTSIRELLDRVVAHHPPRLSVDLDEVADQATIVVEGSYVLVRALGDATIARAQLNQLRNYLELLFSP